MIVDYRDMAGDRVRIEAFRRGIRAVVKPGDVVVEIGSGLGTYAILACRAGARKVYAIEREDVIITARQIAKDNGCADRIEFIQGDALAVALSEKADVAITEDFSCVFVEPGTERLIADTRRRFLKKRGRFIPASVDIVAAPVGCPALYARIDQWARTGDRAYGIDFSATREMALNWLHKATFRPAQLLGSPRRVHRVDLAAGTPFGFDRACRFAARKTGAVHGVAVWFEAALAPRVRLSNAPGAPPTLWGQGFLPLAHPLRARKGDIVAVDLAARFSRDSDAVWWQWEVAAGGVHVGGTTFRSFPTSLARLKAGSRRFRPGLSEDGEVAAYVLQELKTGCTIIEAARRLRRRFHGRFRTLRGALSRVSAAARRYGRRPPLWDDLT